MRPEVQALLWRWREVIVGGVVVALLLWWASASFGVVRWVALGASAVAVIFAIAAIQRARFKGASGGYGAVEVDEGVVSYLTPMGGGQVEIADLTCVLLLPAERGPAHWQIEASGQTPLQIPLDAHGADKLFDVFVTLEGIETEKMLRQLKAAPKSPVQIWRKRTVSVH
ncbi:hypothetical protein [Celeribacter sp.]|uniref:hypothetical protein n=1 Tax=Celeribacter sp. TaxID=1890673 RepID=UPI003A91E19D